MQHQDKAAFGHSSKAKIGSSGLGMLSCVQSIRRHIVCQAKQTDKCTAMSHCTAVTW